MKLTDHFTLEEMVHSDYAKKNRIKNEPNEEQIANLRKLCEMVLEPARMIYGSPITISSGYRSEVLNHCVGGVRNSQHKLGEAADLQCKDLKKLFDIIKDMGVFDQLLFEHSKTATWIHVSYREGRNRGYFNENYKA